jgi:hypothetical protein
LLWWIRQVILVLLSIFFLMFGVDLLIASYSLDKPGWFIMTFFASNLIILISGTLLIGFILRIYRQWRGDRDQEGKP